MNEEIKVIQFIARVNKGGTAVWLNNLISGLRENGVTTLLVAGNISEGEIEDECFSKLSGIRIHSLSQAINPISDFKAIIEMRQLIKRENPDILNTHTAKAGLIGRLVKVSFLNSKYQFRLIHTYHGHLLYGYFPPMKLKFIKFIERRLMSKVDAFIVPGKIVRDELLEKGIGQMEKFRIIYPGVQDLMLSSRLKSRDLLGVKRDAFVVGLLGRLVSIKNPQRVLEIAKNRPSIQFVIGGTGGFGIERSLKQQAPSNVTFTGWTAAELLWSASDIALLTSLNEAQPIALVEAGLASLPAVAENVGSVSEVIINNQNGYLVNSVEETLIAIDKLLTNKIIRKRMGDNARKLALEKYSLNTFVSKHIEYYAEVL